ncbi:unnamed protein product [Didymodactylos carnosus]|uniref:Tetratricopeptide repeat protein n=1 Tax=Didymodactylos carnosus TaxID=1234261 RepID=A0A814SDI2_9BILA|nr:unnamed protein product [Didymodactylos carnosus]CAF3909540.1 unnamed protein product [Didymodactylos carnosus]
MLSERDRTSGKGMPAEMKEQLLNTVDNIENYKIILIVSGQYSRQTLQLLHSNEKINSVYIFCIIKELYQDLVKNKQYSKLIRIFVEYDELFQILEKRINSLLKHLSTFTLFTQNDKSMRNLEQESVHYLWYQLLRDTLINMQTYDSKQEMIDYCQVYYHADIAISINRLMLFDDIQKNAFPFKFINQALRTENIDALYKLRYFIVNFCTSLKRIFDENLELYEDVFDPFLIVYRGLTLSNENIEQLKQSVVYKHYSTKILFGKFLLTTGHFHRAIEYFENLLQTTLTDIERYNIYVKLSDAYNSTRQYNLALNYVLMTTDLETTLFSQSWICPYNLMPLGQLYQQQNNFDYALQYYEKALDTFDIYNQRAIAILHSQIGEIYYNQNNCLYALKHFQIPLEIYQEFYPDDYDGYITAHFNMDRIYDQTMNYSMALKYFQI